MTVLLFHRWVHIGAFVLHGSVIRCEMPVVAERWGHSAGVGALTGMHIHPLLTLTTLHVAAPVELTYKINQYVYFFIIIFLSFINITS